MCSMAISPDLTDYHAKYYAYELTRRYSADSLEKLASTFAGAKVDLNPHQLDAALFAFESPLSRAKKLDGWADDLKVVLEREIKEMDRQIKEAKRAATAAVDLQSKLAGQKQVKALETQRNQQRRSLFDAQDEVDRQRDELIAQIESQLEQKSKLQCLFKIRWHLA
jgi:septal ring factor EnvC (AmiA/AmiB activator)